MGLRLVRLLELQKFRTRLPMFRELLRCRGLAILMILLLEGFHISCLCLFLLLSGGHDICRSSSVHVFFGIVRKDLLGELSSYCMYHDS